MNPILALSVLCGAAWFFVDAFVLPPNFDGTDIYYFKDAGINFAQGLGFVTRFTFGNPTFEYQAYSQYPPLYPLLFWSVLLWIAGFLALKPVVSAYASRFAPYILAVILPIAVFTGFFFPETDRPDGLSVCFGLLAVIALNRGTSSRNEFVAGALCGIALITSPFSGIWASIAVALVVVARHYAKNGLFLVLERLVLAASGAFLVVLLMGAVVAALLPDWFPAFVGVVTGATTHNETGGGYFLALLKGDVRAWVSGFPLGFSQFYVGLAKLLAVQGALAGALVLARFRFHVGWAGWPLVVLLAASPLCLLTSPYQINYPPMTAALLLGAAAGMTAGMPPAPRQYYAMAIVMGFAFLSVLRTRTKSWTL